MTTKEKQEIKNLLGKCLHSVYSGCGFNNQKNELWMIPNHSLKYEIEKYLNKLK